jgi:NADP-dependent 3-hydroxy acid dehydrogenase YdfG
MDKVIVITGASGGIGEATARRLHAAGARVVLGARRAERIDTLVAELGERAAGQACDVTVAADVAALVALGRERFGRVDVLVANAGVGRVRPITELATGEWEEMIDTNLRSVLHGVAAALPVFEAQRSGQFVTVASTAGLTVVPGMAVYAATKTAVRIFSDGLRQELAPLGLRVSLVTPGFVDTPFAEGTGVPEIVQRRDEIAMPADAVAQAIEYAIAQPDAVDVAEVVLRPTVQA